MKKEKSMEGIIKEAEMKGLDVHVYYVSETMGIPIDQVTPEQRQLAKTLLFPYLYK